MTTNDVRMLSGNSRRRKRSAAPASEMEGEVSSKGGAEWALLMLRMLLRTLTALKGSVKGNLQCRCPNERTALLSFLSAR
jgi:hypothetical protein